MAVQARSAFETAERAASHGNTITAQYIAVSSTSLTIIGDPHFPNPKTATPAASLGASPQIVNIA
jgi:hypothetical protein